MSTTTEQRAELDHPAWGFAPVAVRHCMCPDGIRRYARLTGQPDTFFSIPASVKYGGVTVSGFVTGRSNPEGEDYEFCPYTYRKNAGLFARHICPECGNATAGGATFARPDLGCCDSCADQQLAAERRSA
jgi:hypothetical protein